MNEIRGIIFDLGRVLIDIDLNRGLMNRYSNGRNLSDLENLRILYNDPFFLEYETGKKTSRQFYEYLNSKINNKIDYNTFLTEWNNIFNVNPQIQLLFEKLSQKYPVGILSDIDALHWHYIKENYSFIKKVKNPTLSYKTGFLKPHPACYKIAAQNIGVPVNQCLFIDDLEKNVKGAIDAGMTAFQFSNYENLISDLKRLGILNGF
ncbi:MAG: HAD family phosphatase [Calditrichaceae bacterium]|nr:HAD family phosphatase [Calditrichaceae bacterium]MBN2707937.1 HAD family phosphatase [Calditrichaceae bacterium]RQV95374.1 MAG: HAD family phosphatase [Calditrichota bacterium]